jgi:alcohol dehydrogenase (cytochrome c)
MKFLSLFLVLAGAAAAADLATTNDWPSYGGTHAALRYSALDQIKTANVKSLAPAWIFQTGDYENGLLATPIVIDGVIYLSTSNAWVFALDGATGKVNWEYHFTLGSGIGYGKQNRGVAVGNGRVFLGTPDNHLVALDQKTGAEVWRVNVEDSRLCGCSITGAPLLVKDMVIAGVTGGDSAHRGYLTAFDTKTGRMKWRFYTIPGPGEKGHETWPGDSWKVGGGSTWMTGSFDADLNLLYWGIGNAGPDLDASARRGDDLYTCSIVALDPDTGALKWHFQEVPQDVWDFDAAFELYLADLPVGGRTRKVVMQANKTGYVWMLDRVTGEFLKAWPFAKNINWVSGITENGKLVGRVEPEIGKSKMVCPSVVGAKSWNQGAFSPRTGLLYLPSQELCNDLVARKEDVPMGASSTGGNWVIKAPPNGKIEGEVAAYDPSTGVKKWSFPATTWIMASLLATAGDLIFTGDPEGNFFALDAKTGAKLWSFADGAGHRGGAVTYAIGGRQFVATPSGWGSILGGLQGAMWPDAPVARPGSSLVVFALPEVRQ